MIVETSCSSKDFFVGTVVPDDSIRGKTHPGKVYNMITSFRLKYIERLVTFLAKMDGLNLAKICLFKVCMGAPKNGGGPPKWMVYNGKPY